MAAHERPSLNDEWYTPPWVFQALGVDFTMDAASPGAEFVPWIPVQKHLTENSLSRPWRGSVWLNPPYGPRNSLSPWLDKMAAHDNGIALVPNRTGADWWQDAAYSADGLLFVRGKIQFLRPDGTIGASPSYGNVLMSWGVSMTNALLSSSLPGWRSYTPDR